MTFFPRIFLAHLAGHIVCTIPVFTSAVFCENNWLRQFCWHASTIRVGLYYYFLTCCFSLGIQAEPEVGNNQEWFFLFRLIWMTSPTSKQMKEQVSEGWGLGGGWFGVFCPSVTPHCPIDRYQRSRILRKTVQKRENYIWERNKYLIIQSAAFWFHQNAWHPHRWLPGAVGCHSPWSMWWSSGHKHSSSWPGHTGTAPSTQALFTLFLQRFGSR